MGAGVVRAGLGGPDHLHRGLSADAPPPRRPQLALTQHVDGADLTSPYFLHRTIELGLSHTRMEGWVTSARELPELGTLVVRHARSGSESMLVELDGALLDVGLYSGRVWAAVSAADGPAVERALGRLHELLPPPDPSAAHEVTVTFWTYGPQGPVPSWRSIDVPAWDEIRENYASPTRAELEKLMSGFRPAHGGQLILWHGIAGTGKTFGLRALAWEWRDWCDFHYIVDPDTFFGERADYLMAVLLQPEYTSVGPAAVHGFVAQGGMHVVGEPQLADDDEDGEERSANWRVLLLEDTGELLAADARVRVGQGLSRFLNVVDGLIGQGLRVLVLVTTNEEIRRLHPAVARPGRAAANVEFVPLPADEANAWLERRGTEERVSGPATLASLYARKEGLDPGADPSLPGFGG